MDMQETQTHLYAPVGSFMFMFTLREVRSTSPAYWARIVSKHAILDLGGLPRKIRTVKRTRTDKRKVKPDLEDVARIQLVI